MNWHGCVDWRCTSACPRTALDLPSSVRNLRETGTPVAPVHLNWFCTGVVPVYYPALRCLWRFGWGWDWRRALAHELCRLEPGVLARPAPSQPYFNKAARTRLQIKEPSRTRRPLDVEPARLHKPTPVCEKKKEKILILYGCVDGGALCPRPRTALDLALLTWGS